MIGGFHPSCIGHDYVTSWLTTVTRCWHIYHSLHLNRYRRSRTAQHASSSTYAIMTASLHVWSNFTGYQFKRGWLLWCTVFSTSVCRTSLTLFSPSRWRQRVEVYVRLNQQTMVFRICILSLRRELSLIQVQLRGTACSSPSAERHLRQSLSSNFFIYEAFKHCLHVICCTDCYGFVCPTVCLKSLEDKLTHGYNKI